MVGLVDRVSHEPVTEIEIHSLALNSHIVCALIITSGGVKEVNIMLVRCICHTSFSEGYVIHHVI